MSIDEANNCCTFVQNKEYYYDANDSHQCSESQD